MAKTEMLFAIHGGSRRDKLVGIVMQNHVLPIAFKETGDAENGFRALWEASMGVEEFFEGLRIEYTKSSGIWYLCSEYEEDDVTDYQDDWEHLADKDPRRVNANDMKDLMVDTHTATSTSSIYNRWRWV